jgi:integrase
MRKYDPKTAAKKIVISNTQHGLSRHKFPELAMKKVSGVLTEIAHVSALTGYARWLLQTRGKHLKHATSVDAQQYLEFKASNHSQSTVSLARQSINFHILPNTPIAFISSNVPTEPKNRAYTMKQIDLLVDSASPALGMSILIAADAGLREMELITICESSFLKESGRDWKSERFTGRHNDEIFVVRGKGGLHRQVRLNKGLAVKLRSLRRPVAVQVNHRGAHLVSHFELIAGHQLASQFGRLSKAVLGFSHGAHGLRHTFAQRRRNELICSGFSLVEAVVILSQELGHFSIKNTLAYLRDY